LDEFVHFVITLPLSRSGNSFKQNRYRILRQQSIFLQRDAVQIEQVSGKMGDEKEIAFCEKIVSGYEPVFKSI
jgi:hypothetical protein